MSGAPQHPKLLDRLSAVAGLVLVLAAFFFQAFDVIPVNAGIELVLKGFIQAVGTNERDNVGKILRAASFNVTSIGRFTTFTFSTTSATSAG